MRYEPVWRNSLKKVNSLVQPLICGEAAAAAAAVVVAVVEVVEVEVCVSFSVCLEMLQHTAKTLINTGG